MTCARSPASLSLSDQDIQEMTPASDEPQAQQPGSGPSAGGGTERAREGRCRLACVFPSMALLLLSAVVCGWDAAVTRKKRGPRARAVAPSWWAFRLPAVPPPPPARARRKKCCQDCGATKTSQWKAGPMGPSTLCNTCGVRRWATGERWGVPRRRRLATAATVSDQPPPPPQQQIPMVSPPEDSPAWQGPLPEGYLVARGNAATKRNSPSPATATAATDDDSEQPPAASPQEIPDPVYSPSPPKKNKAAAAAAARKKKKRNKKCAHCGSSETPQWRESPRGRSTLCNACGVRHRQGRLLPEYRPLASPSFEPAVHSSLHAEVLELRRQRRDKQLLAPAPARQQQPAHDDYSQDVDLMPTMTLPRYLVARELRAGAAAARDDSANGIASAAPSMSVAGTGQVDQAASLLDPFLLDGPAPPMIIDEPYWMMGDPPAGPSVP